MSGITHSFVSAKADGGDSTLVKPSDWNAVHIGGLAPTIIQAMNSGTSNTALTLTLDQAPTSGNVLVLGSFSNGSAGLSTVTCTNVTWTKMITGTAITATKMEIWIGKVSGAGGTTITITRAGGNAIWSVIEITETVTPTAGNTIDITGVNKIGGMAAPTTGHLVAFAAGGVNQNSPVSLTATIPISGIMMGIMTAVAVGYSQGNRIYMAAQSGDTTAFVACEIT